MPNLKSCLGETRMMKCGMEATCIAYRGYEDIDVRFSDGTEVFHKTKGCFIKGSIANPVLGKNASNMKSIVGLTMLMKNGQLATCVNYRRSDDLDVRFEDGTLVTRKAKTSFLNGKIDNPNHSRYMNTIAKNSCAGESRLMKNGQRATCIAYRGANDIDVQFEDDVIVHNKSKSNFYRGEIANPVLGRCVQKKKRSSIVGQTAVMNCGMACTCISYRNSQDIDVQFEDGTVVEHISKYSFEKGKVANPTLGRYFSIFGNTNCIGETVLMNCGMEATCISFRNVDDIDVRFSDGTVIEHRSKGSFLRGEIGHPMIPTRSLPEALVYYAMKEAFPDAISCFRPDWLRNAKTGHNMEIDIWIPSKKTGIEYDGTKWHSANTFLANEKAHMIEESLDIDVLYTILEKGAVSHFSPKHRNIQLHYSSISEEYYDLICELQEVVGNIISSLGGNAEIDILKATEYDTVRNLLRGKIAFETTVQDSQIGIRLIRPKKKSDFSVAGLTLKMNNGQSATCISDQGSKNIMLEFEDGTVIASTRVAFRKRYATNPVLGRQYVQSVRTSILGEKKVMNCGMEAICIADRGSMDIDVQFADGTLICHKQRTHFRKGTIRNPNMKTLKKTKEIES